MNSRIIYFPGVIDFSRHGILENHSDIVSQLLQGEYQSLELKKKHLQIEGESFVTVKINRKDRILFWQFKQAEETYLVCLEAIMNHDYQKSWIDPKRLTALKTLLGELRPQLIQLIEQEQQRSLLQLPSLNLKTWTPINRNTNKLYILDENQEDSIAIPFPKVLYGQPGSGKSLILINDLSNKIGLSLKQKILMLAESKRLLRELNDNWMASIFYEENKDLVLCMTYKQLMRYLFPEKKWLGAEDFMAWFSIYHEEIKRAAKISKEKQPILTFINSQSYEDLYQRLSLVAAYNSESYKSFPGHYEREQKNWLWECCQQYKEYLVRNDKQHLMFSSISQYLSPSQCFDAIYIDESQKLCLQQIKNLGDLSNWELCCVLDNQQDLDCHESKRPHFEVIFNEGIKRSSNPSRALQFIKLNRSYRCPLQSEPFLNKILEIKCRLGAFDDKEQYKKIQSISQEKGGVFWLQNLDGTKDPRNEKPVVEFLKRIQDSANFCVLTLEKNLEKYRKIFGQEILVLSIEKSTGLEFKYVLLVDPLDDGIFVKAAAKLKTVDWDEVPNMNRPKRGEEGSAFKIPFSELLVAASRSTKFLVVCQDLANKILPLAEQLRAQCTKADLFEEIVLPSTPEEWMNLMASLIKVDQIKEAKAVATFRLNMTECEFAVFLNEQTIASSKKKDDKQTTTIQTQSLSKSNATFFNETCKIISPSTTKLCPVASAAISSLLVSRGEAPAGKSTAEAKSATRRIVYDKEIKKLLNVRKAKFSIKRLKNFLNENPIEKLFEAHLAEGYSLFTLIMMNEFMKSVFQDYLYLHPGLVKKIVDNQRVIEFKRNKKEIHFLVFLVESDARKNDIVLVRTFFDRLFEIKLANSEEEKIYSAESYFKALFENSTNYPLVYDLTLIPVAMEWLNLTCKRLNFPLKNLAKILYHPNTISLEDHSSLCQNLFMTTGGHHLLYDVLTAYPFVAKYISPSLLTCHYHFQDKDSVIQSKIILIELRKSKIGTALLKRLCRLNQALNHEVSLLPYTSDWAADFEALIRMGEENLSGCFKGSFFMKLLNQEEFFESAEFSQIFSKSQEEIAQIFYQNDAFNNLSLITNIGLHVELKQKFLDFSENNEKFLILLKAFSLQLFLIEKKLKPELTVKKILLSLTQTKVGQIIFLAILKNYPSIKIPYEALTMVLETFHSKCNYSALHYLSENNEGLNLSFKLFLNDKQLIEKLTFEQLTAIHWVKPYDNHLSCLLVKYAKSKKGILLLKIFIAVKTEDENFKRIPIDKWEKLYEKMNEDCSCEKCIDDISEDILTDIIVLNKIQYNNKKHSSAKISAIRVYLEALFSTKKSHNKTILIDIFSDNNLMGFLFAALFVNNGSSKRFLELLNQHIKVIKSIIELIDTNPELFQNVFTLEMMNDEDYDPTQDYFKIFPTPVGLPLLKIWLQLNPDAKISAVSLCRLISLCSCKVSCDCYKESLIEILSYKEGGLSILKEIITRTADINIPLNILCTRFDDDSEARGERLLDKLLQDEIGFEILYLLEKNNQEFAVLELEKWQRLFRAYGAVYLTQEIARELKILYEIYDNLSIEEEETTISSSSSSTERMNEYFAEDSDEESDPEFRAFMN